MIAVPFLGTSTPTMGYWFIDKRGQTKDTKSLPLAFHPDNFPPMAHFRKHGTGWQANIEKRGVRESKTFPLKAEAQAWAARREAEIVGGEKGIPNLTLDAVFERYARDVSSKKKGAKWEKARIGLVRRDPLALVRLRDFGKVQVAEWRERRLESVKPASVRREWNLLNNACNLAVGEWGWLKANPFALVKRPPDGKPRKRIASQPEIDLLIAHASPNLKRCILWAVETGMRAGEIAALLPDDVVGNVATVRDSKNNTSREVPLSAKALEQLPAPFGLTNGSISGLFAKLCKSEAVKIEGLTFHDLRATAATRLAKKLNPLQLAKMFGWKDVSMALTYYRETAEDVAKLL